MTIETASTKVDEKLHILTYIFAFLIAVVCIGLWFPIQNDQAINTENAFLTTAAISLLDGASMSDAYYDTNPPLSILIYTPPAFFIKNFGLSLDYTIFFYSIFLVCLSTFILFRILQKTDFSTPSERLAFTTVFLLANLIATRNDFGQRDHFLILTLIPFIFAQLAISYKKTLPPVLKWSALIMGVVFILLKPHYGLIPTLILVHRAVTQKKWKTIFDGDFLALSFAVIAYISIILLFFWDFATVIFPDSLKFYNTAREPWIFFVSLSIVLMSVIFCFVSMYIFKRPHKLAALLFIIAGLCAIPFYMQGKGYIYQAIPTGISFICAFTLLIHHMASELQAKIFSRISLVNLAPLVAIIFLACGIFYALPPNINYPSRSVYLDDPLAKTIRECENACSFFLFNDQMQMIAELSFYTGKPHASRFPSFWFLPYILWQDYGQRQGFRDIDADGLHRLKKKYADMVLEDLMKHEPDTIILGRFKLNPFDQEPFNFIEFFSQGNSGIKDFFKSYTLDQTIPVDRSRYFDGWHSTKEKIILYDIYKRKKDPTEKRQISDKKQKRVY